MSYNLADLSPDQRTLIELDKQASFLVWQIKQAKVGPEAIVRQAQSLKSDEEKAAFEQSIDKYKKQMGVV